jgi:hypothetical protein
MDYFHHGRAVLLMILLRYSPPQAHLAHRACRDEPS